MCNEWDKYIFHTDICRLGRKINIIYVPNPFFIQSLYCKSTKTHSQFSMISQQRQQQQQQQEKKSRPTLQRIELEKPKLLRWN